jgi:signal transduction histidine kinase
VKKKSAISYENDDLRFLELTGGIAHDLNNILSTILGYSEMLHEDHSETSASSEKLRMIHEAVVKAQSLTNLLLTFSRKVEQKKVPVNVSEVLKETIRFVSTGIPSDIDVKCLSPKKDVIVLADPVQLFRVFFNIITNAVQSMEEKGGTLSVELAVVEGKLVANELNRDKIADEYAFLTFKDTGKGMEPSVKSKILEPFFTTREAGKGTGLGLSVVKGIVSEMEGEILISSKHKKGSIFNIYLPVLRDV